MCECVYDVPCTNPHECCIFYSCLIQHISTDLVALGLILCRTGRKATRQSDELHLAWCTGLSVYMGTRGVCGWFSATQMQHAKNEEIHGVDYTNLLMHRHDLTDRGKKLPTKNETLLILENFLITGTLVDRKKGLST